MFSRPWQPVSITMAAIAALATPVAVRAESLKLAFSDVTYDPHPDGGGNAHITLEVQDSTGVRVDGWNGDQHGESSIRAFLSFEPGSHLYNGAGAEITTLQYVFISGATGQTLTVKSPLARTVVVSIDKLQTPACENENIDCSATTVLTFVHGKWRSSA